jgi:hypothetical protein
LWHKVDIVAVMIDVRFRGQSGHSTARSPCPLMTRSGHSSVAYDVANGGSGATKTLAAVLFGRNCSRQLAISGIKENCPQSH